MVPVAESKLVVTKPKASGRNHMKHHVFCLGFCMLAVSLVLAGCNSRDASLQLPNDALEALQEINNVAQGIKSAHFTMLMTIEMAAEDLDVNLELTSQGDVELRGPSPQDANMQMEMTLSVLGQEIRTEMVTVNGAHWMRQEGQDWQKVPAASVNLTGGLGGDPAAALRYLNRAKEVKRLNDDKIDGVDTYHFGFSMNADVLDTPDLLGQLTSAGQLTDEQAKELLESAVLKGQVWVNKADLLPRREMIDMAFEISSPLGLGEAAVKYNLQMDIGFSKINEPVKIQAPSS